MIDEAKKLIEENCEGIDKRLREGILLLVDCYNNAITEKNKVFNNSKYIKQNNTILDLIHKLKLRELNNEILGKDVIDIMSNCAREDLIILSDEYKRDISPNLRFKILHRDGFTCNYCGRKAPEVKLEIDHKIPFSKGGRTKEDNLTTSCRDCNIGKGNKISIKF